MKSVQDGECVVPRATQEGAQEAVGYPAWSLAGGRGWRKGVVVIGSWGNRELQGVQTRARLRDQQQGPFLPGLADALGLGTGNVHLSSRGVSR